MCVIWNNPEYQDGETLIDNIFVSFGIFQATSVRCSEYFEGSTI